MNKHSFLFYFGTVKLSVNVLYSGITLMNVGSLPQRYNIHVYKITYRGKSFPKVIIVYSPPYSHGVAELGP